MSKKAGKKVPKVPKVPKAEKKVWWKEADWSKTDTVLGKEFGRSRQRVHQIRRREGYPASEDKGRQFGTGREKIEELDCKGMTAAEVGEKCGVETAWAEQVLDELGKEYKKVDGRKLRSRYDWGSVTAREWYELQDKEIAAKLGIDCYPMVGQYRRRKGILKGSRRGDSGELEPRMTVEEIQEVMDREGLPGRPAVEPGEERVEEKAAARARAREVG
jgi:hypothetical protein